MDLLNTSLLLAGGLGIFCLALWIERRPKKTLDVRLIPTTPVLIVGAVIIIVAAIHLVSLMGGRNRVRALKGNDFLRIVEAL